LVAIFDIYVLQELLRIYSENFPDDISIKKVHQIFKEKDYKFLYLQQNKKILGGLVLTQIDDDLIYIEYLFVDKEYQSKGVGKKLLNKLLDDYSDFRISLHCENFLIKYYEKFGFTQKEGIYYFRNKKFNLMVFDKNNSLFKIINSDIVIELLNDSVWCK